MANYEEYDALDYDEALIETVNTGIDDLDGEDVTLMGLAIDNSSSMTPYVIPMGEAMEATKKALLDSKNADEIHISRIDFDSSAKASGYLPISEMETDYPKRVEYGSTAIYDMIVNEGEALREYRKYLRDNGYRVRAVFAIFTDGEDTCSKKSIQDAKEIIDKMNREEIITVMIEFGSDAAGIAKSLGIMKTISCNSTEHDLREAFATVSKSVVSVSQNVAASDAFDF